MFYLLYSNSENLSARDRHLTEIYGDMGIFPESGKIGIGPLILPLAGPEMTFWIDESMQIS